MKQATKNASASSSARLSAPRKAGPNGQRSANGYAQTNSAKQEQEEFRGSKVPHSDNNFQDSQRNKREYVQNENDQLERLDDRENGFQKNSSTRQSRS